ncbi:MAG: hypothetical protein HC914_20885, partial [Chloroflexaceae bacterium]|nr:hypothetical protein [Chloroflexaceae bacterium]
EIRFNNARIVRDGIETQGAEVFLNVHFPYQTNQWDIDGTLIDGSSLRASRTQQQLIITAPEPMIGSGTDRRYQGTLNLNPTVVSDGTNFIVAWERVILDELPNPTRTTRQIILRGIDGNGNMSSNEHILVSRQDVFTANIPSTTPYFAINLLGRAGTTPRITWQERAGPRAGMILLQPIGSTGAPLCCVSTIATGAEFDLHSIAYDPLENRLLLAYTGRSSGLRNVLQLRTVLLSANTIPIQHNVFNAVILDRPSVAYEPYSKSWLVTWPAGRSLGYVALGPNGTPQERRVSVGNSNDAQVRTHNWFDTTILSDPAQLLRIQRGQTLACPAPEAPPVLELPFEEFPGATTFENRGTGGNSVACSGAACPTAGVSGLSQEGAAPPSEFAVQFDGGDDRINAGNINLANRSFTVSFWAKREQQSRFDMVVSQGTTEQNRSLSIGFRDNNQFVCAFGFNDLRTDSALSDTAWHHWACTYDVATNTRIIYRDSNEVARHTATADYQGTGDLFIGNWQFGNAFRGAIDQVAIYPTALNADAIAGLYRNERQDFCLAAAPAPNTERNPNNPDDVPTSAVQPARLSLRPNEMLLARTLIAQNTALTLTIDADLPTATVDSVREGAYLPLPQGGTLILGGSASDRTSQIDRVEVSLSGGPFEAATGAEAWSYALALTEGVHQLRSRAIDVVGHVGNPSAPRTFLVDGTPPQVTFDAPADPIGAVQNRVGDWLIDLSGSATDPTIDGSPGSGVQLVEVLLEAQTSGVEGNAWQPASLGRDGNWNIVYEMPKGMQDPTGTYTVSVRALDHVGNRTTRDAVRATLGVDTHAPEVHLETVNDISIVDPSLYIENGAVVTDTLNAVFRDTRTLSTTARVAGLVTDTLARSAGIASVEAAWVPLEQVAVLNDTVLQLPLDESPQSEWFADRPRRARCAVCRASPDHSSNLPRTGRRGRHGSRALHPHPTRQRQYHRPSLGGYHCVCWI